MCGIISYIGKRNCKDILLEGLRRLEYRGYDSAGLAGVIDGKLQVLKKVGKVAKLESEASKKDWDFKLGIAHTRWATHGGVTEENAHPHINKDGTIAVVHNGIIENHNALRKLLTKEGYEFKSNTDTEIIAHLIDKYYEDNLEKAVVKALQQVDGTYGIAVISSKEPDKLVAARQGSPVVLAIGDNEFFVASDVNAVVGYAKNVVYLNDGEIVTIKDGNFDIIDLGYVTVEPDIQEVNLEVLALEKGEYPHYMLKEIFEQPEALENTLRGRVDMNQGVPALGGIKEYYPHFQRAKRIILTACGTAWHAGLIGEYLLEELAGIPSEVDYASEFRYRSPILDNDTIVIVISQSGETADTLAALREAKVKGATVLGICNVVGSTIARETVAGVYTHAGPEIGVASTKAFTTQIGVLSLMALLAGRMRTISITQGMEYIKEIQALPDKMRTILALDDAIKKIAQEFMTNKNFLYLGRGYNFPVALEGALKLKEISYIHAEGYPAAEMKHGPIALIDENMPVVAIATADHTYEKILSNIEEIRARKGRVIAIATEGDEIIEEKAEKVIYIPETLSFLTPFLSVIPLQLLAYHIAVLKGCDVDKPRNLAKSVTVE